jgi:hypothetical protein
MTYNLVSKLNTNLNIGNENRLIVKIKTSPGELIEGGLEYLVSGKFFKTNEAFRQPMFFISSLAQLYKIGTLHAIRVSPEIVL